MSLAKQLGQTLRHASIYSMANILQKGIGFLMIPVYTHYLSPHDYGILELIDLFLMVASMLTGMGLGSAVVRFYHEQEDPERRTDMLATGLWSVVGLTLGAYFVLSRADVMIARLVLNDASYAPYFQIVFISLMLQTIASAPESLLLAEKRSGQFSLVTLLTFVSYLSLNILFIVGLGYGVLGMLYSVVITKAFNNLLLFFFTWRQYRLRFCMTDFKRLLAFGLPLVPASFSMFAIHYADRFFIQRYCGPDELGLYSLGYKFGMIVSVLISQPIFNIWNTQRYEVAKSPTGGSEVGRMFTYIWALILFAGLCVAVPADEVVALMAPGSYQGAAHIVGLIVASYMVYGLSSLFELGIFVSNKTGYDFYIKTVTAAVTIGLNAVLVPNFGIYGAAVATLLTFCCLAVLTFLVSQRLYHVHYEYGRLLRLTIAALAVYGASRLVHGGLLVAVPVKGALLLAFLPLLAALGFLNQSERQHLLGLARRFGLAPAGEAGS